MPSDFEFQAFASDNAVAFATKCAANQPATPLEFNSAMTLIAKLADACAAPKSLFKQGATTTQYAGLAYSGGLSEALDKDWSGKNVPIVGLLSLPENLPRTWFAQTTDPNQSSLEADQRLWGLALVAQLALYRRFWRLIPNPALRTSGDVVTSTAALEAASVVAIPAQLEGLFAPIAAADKASPDVAPKLVTFAQPFDGRCNGNWDVFSGAGQFVGRLAQFLMTGRVSPAGADEKNTATRAKALELGSAWQAAIEMRSRNVGIALGGLVGAALLGGYAGHKMGHRQGFGEGMHRAGLLHAMRSHGGSSVARSHSGRFLPG